MPTLCGCGCVLMEGGTAAPEAGVTSAQPVPIRSVSMTFVPDAPPEFARMNTRERLAASVVTAVLVAATLGVGSLPPSDAGFTHSVTVSSPEPALNVYLATI